MRERGGVKGKCKVFGLSDRESLEFIPEAVGSHRKMLSLGWGGRGEGTGSDAIITKEGSQDWEHRPGRQATRMDSSPGSAPNSLWAPGQDKTILWASISPTYKEPGRNKSPLKAPSGQVFLVQDSLTQIFSG